MRTDRPTGDHGCSASPPPARSTTASRTLIGRLLYDSKSIFEDQLEARRGDQPRDAATTTPTWRCSPTACAPSASRASRSTSPTATSPRRSASSSSPTRPGHVQYTRNMVTGASTADLALVLVDARQGLAEQSRRHAFLASLLRVPHLVLCVNKMDLVDFDAGASSSEIRDEFTDVRGQARHPRPRRSSRSRRCTATTSSTARANMPWYDGPDAAAPPRARARRLRPQPDRRPLPGAVRHPARSPTSTTTTAATPARSPAACSSRATRSSCCRQRLRPRRSRASTLFDGPVDEAFPPMSVTVRLADDVDVSPRRHDLPAATTRPTPSQDIDAMVCWMTDAAAAPAAEAAPSSTPPASARALVKDLQYRLDVNTLHRDEDADGARRSTRSAGSSCAPRRRCSSTSTAEPHHRLLHPHRRGDQRHRRRRHDPLDGDPRTSAGVRGA